MLQIFLINVFEWEEDTFRFTYRHAFRSISSIIAINTVMVDIYLNLTLNILNNCKFQVIDYLFYQKK